MAKKKIITVALHCQNKREDKTCNCMNYTVRRSVKAQKAKGPLAVNKYCQICMSSTPHKEKKIAKNN